MEKKQKNGCVLQQNIVFWVNLKIPHQINKIPQFSELGAGFPALFRICRYSPEALCAGEFGLKQLSLTF